jgi:hypothetical protein
VYVHAHLLRVHKFWQSALRSTQCGSVLLGSDAHLEDLPVLPLQESDEKDDSRRPEGMLLHAPDTGNSDRSTEGADLVRKEECVRVLQLYPMQASRAGMRMSLPI